MDGGQSVFVKVDHHEFGSFGCSGLQFDNVVIIHASAIYVGSYNSYRMNERLNSDDTMQNFQLMVNELKQQQYFVNSKESRSEETFNFQIVREKSSNFNATIFDIENYKSVGLDGKRKETYSYEDAELCLIHKYEEGDIINNIFSLGFNEDLNLNSCLMNSIFPVFLFLMTGVPDKHLFQKTTHTLLTYIEGIPLYPGLSIDVESTPFASLAFYNSLSRGIICKTLGPDQQGLIIDARLTLGCEGAPIHVSKNGSKGPVIGIVAGLLGTCEHGCVGFSIGLNLKRLLKSVLGLLPKDYIPFNKVNPPNPASLLDMDLLSSAVIFVRCQHKWGSGVVVNADLGLILTCSHIVFHAQDSVCVVYKGKKYPAQVVYASPPSAVYDLALLQVEKITGLRSLVLANTSPVKGESIFTVGYASSTELSVMSNGTPTLSLGCVAKLSAGGGPLHTTCCTQAGASGGAVLRPPDQLIGLVVSNVQVGAVVLPFFGIAVSVDDFRDTINEFISTGNRVCLQSLTVKNHELKLKWMLQGCKL